MTVSVIIIFLNAGRFLQEAIDSVFDQTHQDWELILVDDGSTDAGTGLAQAAAGRDAGRVRYAEHPGHENRGTSASRNFGLQLARGEHVLYLDADDILLPGALQHLLTIMVEHPDVGLAFGSTLWWFWAPEFAAKRDHVQPYLGWAGQVIAPPRFLTAMVRTEDVHPANCSTMLRRSVINALGGFDMAFRGMYEDTVLLAKMLLAAKAYASDEVLSVYRMHPASQCHTAMTDGSYHMTGPNQARERYLRWLRSYKRHAGDGDLRLDLTLRREIWLYDRPRLHALVESPAVKAALGWARRRVAPAAPGECKMAGQVTGSLTELEAFYRRHGKAAEADAVHGRRQSWISAAD